MPTLTTQKPDLPSRFAAGYSLADQSGLQDAIHAPHAKLRDRVMDTLFNSGIPDLQRQAAKMSECACSIHLFFDQDAGTVREYTHTCKARLCPHCGRRRSNHVAKQMYPLVDQMKQPRHLVLTVKSRPAELRDQAKDLVRWFAKLRRTPFWRKNVTQGVYTVEITVNERTGLWHPHVHIIFDGQYLPQAKIRHLWHDITGGSEIVWIEQAYNKDGLVRELCKYIGKPQKSEHWTDRQIIEYAQAVKGMRMVQTFGKKRPKPINDEAPTDEKQGEDESISLARLIWLAEKDQRQAVQVLPMIAIRWPHIGRYIYNRMPQLEPDLTREQRMLRVMATIDAGRAPPGLVTPQDAAGMRDMERDIANLLGQAVENAKQSYMW